MKNKTFSEPLSLGSSGKNLSKKTARRRLKWHPAFVQAMQLELFDYKDSLEFKQEYQLTAEPLRIDLLIIKKPKELVIDKNIARIFRTDNIIEYKSPGDYLSVKDFLKVYAYANLYAAITPGVDMAGITLTFIESRRPRKLLKYLKSVRSYKVKEASPGIFTVTGDYLPIQIVVSKRLPEGENLWLNSLRNDLKVGNLDVILNKSKRPSEKISIDAYIDLIDQVTEETYKEEEYMYIDTIARMCERTGLKDKWMEQFLEQGREEVREESLEKSRRDKLQAARNFLAMGFPIDQIAKGIGLPVDEIAKL